MTYLITLKTGNSERVECDSITRESDSITFVKRYPTKEGTTKDYIEAMYMVSEIVGIKLEKLT
ncbi:MAG TPA: hypothetical protein VFO76_08940 [Candidatus Kapabacteria bacterium]|nr:hypothetical protein [Candidatus Kapabacteria bacterium]